VTRQKSYQRGFVSDPIRTRRGIAFKIRYRVRTAAGDWKQRSETLYDLAGKKAARDVLLERLKDSLATKPAVRELTLREFIESFWNPLLDRKALKASTRESYICALKCHVLPAFGEHRIRDIVPLHMEEFSQAKTNAGLSAKTVRNLLLVLQGIFSLAVDHDLILKSPIRKCHKPVYKRREKPNWSPKEVLSIIQAAPLEYRSLFCCAALTGARLGELLALQMKHNDLAKGKLRIEQSIWRGKIVPPKTQNSIRTIYFGVVLAAAFAQQVHRLVNNGPEDYVFCKDDGSPLHPDVLRKDVLYPILDKLGIVRIPGGSGFHTFRHSAASILNERTGNLKLAQKLLGHANIDITADVYTHTSSGAEHEAAIAIERAIYGDLFPVVPDLGNRNNSAVVNAKSELVRLAHNQK
jgi:integrase